MPTVRNFFRATTKSAAAAAESCRAASRGFGRWGRFRAFRQAPCDAGCRHLHPVPEWTRQRLDPVPRGSGLSLISASPTSSICPRLAVHAGDIHRLQRHRQTGADGALAPAAFWSGIILAAIAVRVIGLLIEMLLSAYLPRARMWLLANSVSGKDAVLWPSGGPFAARPACTVRWTSSARLFQSMTWS